MSPKESYQNFWEMLKKDSSSQPQNVNEYIGLSVLIIVMFFALFHLFYQLNSIFNKVFREMSFTEKSLYISKILSILHAVFVCVLSFYAMIYLCENPNNTIFSDSDCLNSPKVFHRFSALITIAYLIQDLIAMIFLCRDFTPLGYQFMLHHVTAISSFSLALYTEHNIILTAAIINQFTEISTPFLNLRQFMYIHKAAEGPLFTINSISFLLSFLIGRLGLQFVFIYISYPVLADIVSNIEKTYPTQNQQMIFYYCAFCQVLGVLLNLYWFRLIFAGFIRLISRSNPKTKSE